MPIIMLLSNEGHSVQHVEDGTQALHLIGENISAWDVIISDLNLPGVSGVDLIETAHQHRFSGKLIAYSGMVPENTRARLKAANCNEILHKPFEIGALLRTLPTDKSGG
jgi:CheY-like chemotaxis protein